MTRKHYAVGKWVDFIRGVGDPNSREPMRRHLESGCARCADLVAALTRVVDVAEAERGHAPPELAVRSVIARFGLPEGPHEPLVRRIGLRVMFDSALGPAPAGLRSARPQERQVLLEGDGYHLDLNIGPCDQAGLLRVDGQLFDASTEPVPEAAVSLLHGGTVEARCATGELGDFGLEGRERLPLHLRIAVRDGRQVDLMLDRDRVLVL